MRRTLFILAAMLALVLGFALLAQAQLVYNPSYLLWEHTDYAATSHYIVDVWNDPPGETPLISEEIPKEEVLVYDQGLGTYQLSFSKISPLPAGRSYRFAVRARGTSGAVSQPSNISPQYARFTHCAVGEYVRPMTASVVFPTNMTAGAFAFATVDIVAPAPVHRVVVDFLGDGLPAWYFYSTHDLAGPRTFVIGPLPRTGVYRVVLDAVDEQGCVAQFASQFATVK